MCAMCFEGISESGGTVEEERPTENVCEGRYEWGPDPESFNSRWRVWVHLSAEHMHASTSHCTCAYVRKCVHALLFSASTGVQVYCSATHQLGYVWHLLSLIHPVQAVLGACSTSVQFVMSHEITSSPRCYSPPNSLLPS